MEPLYRLALALALGLLIGAERGWQMRGAPEGGRVAGVRTFTLVSLLGGLWALIGEALGPALLGFSFLALALILMLAHWTAVRLDADQGITTLVAALVTFALGALAVLGYETIAAAGAVVTALLLSMKKLLHGWLQRIQGDELVAALKLLLISVVLLPLLPNRGMGPWQALNPYELWWLVVLIAALSFAGYVAVRLVGAGRGTLLTGLLGGLTSSTATAIHFARLNRHHGLPDLYAAGTLVAATTMFPRMLVVVAIVNPALVAPLAPPLAAMTLTGGLVSLLFWLRRKPDRPDEAAHLRNPLDLAEAFKFGLLLAGVMFASKGLYSWLGDTGIFVAAGVAGIADVDAITLSLSRMAPLEISAGVAVSGIVLAAVINTFSKTLMAWFVGGAALAARLVPASVVVAAAGGATVVAYG